MYLHAAYMYLQLQRSRKSVPSMRLRSNRSSLDKVDGLILASIANHLAGTRGWYHSSKYFQEKEWDNVKEVCMLSITCKKMHDVCQSAMMHSSSDLHAILTHGCGAKQGLVQDAMLSMLRSTKPFIFTMRSQGDRVEESKCHVDYTERYNEWGVTDLAEAVECIEQSSIEIKALHIPVAGEVIFLLTDKLTGEGCQWGGVSLLHCATKRTPISDQWVNILPEELCVHSLEDGKTRGELRRFDMEAVGHLKESLKMVPGNADEVLSTPQLVSLLAYHLGAEFEQVMCMLRGTQEEADGGTKRDVMTPLGNDGPYGEDLLRMDGPGGFLCVREGYGLYQRQFLNGVRVRHVVPGRYGGLSVLITATASICNHFYQEGYVQAMDTRRGPLPPPKWLQERAPEVPEHEVYPVFG